MSSLLPTLKWICIAAGKIALFPAKEIGRYISFSKCCEKSIPVIRFARQDDITRNFITANKYLAAVEPIGCRKAHCLTAPIRKNLCRLGHEQDPSLDIYQDIYSVRNSQPTRSRLIIVLLQRSQSGFQLILAQFPESRKQVGLKLMRDLGKFIIGLVPCGREFQVLDAPVDVITLAT